MTTTIEHSAPLQSQTKVQNPWPLPVEVDGMSTKVKERAEADAERLLRTAARESFGIEPVGIAERVGVQVGEPQLDQDIFGALFMESGAVPRIVLNARQGFLRGRFTCALELGHYVHVSAKANEYKRVDLRDRTVERGGKSDDVYAFEFAASLLMPRTDVELLAELKVDDLEMALRFFVPREIMQARLRALGLPVPVLEAA